MDETQTSKQPFSQDDEDDTKRIKKRNQATHRRWQNNEPLQTRTVNIQRSTKAK